jgi:hypothetical protein
VDDKKRPLLLVFRVGEGDKGGWRAGKPLRLAFQVKEGDKGGWQAGKPLRLTFQVREGMRDWLEGKQSPPSHISSEGGVLVCQQRVHPLHLTFRVREGMVV